MSTIRDFLDDQLGIDPSGGGIFDPNTGLIGGGQPRADASWNLINRFVPGVNPVTGQPVAPGGQVDLTAPGLTTTENINPLGQTTAPLGSASAIDASNLYRQGAPGLSPLEVNAYNRVSPTAAAQRGLGEAGAGVIGGILGGDSAYANRLAARTAAARDIAGAGTGTLGGLRSSYGRDKAVSDAIIDAQLDAQGRVGTAQQDLSRPVEFERAAGEKHRQFQESSPWDWLSNYQKAIGFGQNVPSTETSIKTPSGADIYQAQLANELIKANIGSIGGTAPNVTPGTPANPGTGGTGGTGGDITDLIDAGKDLWDIGKDIYDWWKS